MDHRTRAASRVGGQSARPPQRTAFGVAAPDAAWFRLQRSAGNRALAQVLARQPKQAPQKEPQKPPMPLTPMEGASYAPPAILTPEDRASLKAITSLWIGNAFGAFTKAVDRHLVSIKAEDAHKAELAGAMFEIVFGFAAPIFASRVMNSAGRMQKLAAKLSSTLSTTKTATHAAKAKSAAEAAATAKTAGEAASKAKTAADEAHQAWVKADKWARDTNRAYKPAVDAADAATKAMSKAGGAAELAGRQAGDLRAAAEAAAKAEAALNPVKLITEAQFLTNGFNAVGKIAAAEVKTNPRVFDRMFAETEIDEFASKLRTQFHKGVNKLQAELLSPRSTITDQQLLAMWAAYDDEFTNELAYAELLKEVFKNFKTYVRPIGKKREKGRDVAITEDTRAVWFKGRDGGKRLALYKYRHISAGSHRNDSVFFLGWVPKDMEDFAIKKTVATFKQVETIEEPELFKEREAAQKRITDDAPLREAVEKRRRDDERLREAAAEKRRRDDERLRKIERDAERRGDRDQPEYVPLP